MNQAAAGSGVLVAIAGRDGPPSVYAVPSSLQSRALPGGRVVVPRGSAREIGLVLAAVEEEQTPFGGPRPVLEAPDERPAVPADLVRLVEWAADYYFAPPGVLAAAVLPPMGGSVEGPLLRLTRRGAADARSLLPMGGGAHTRRAGLKSLGARAALLSLLHEAGAEGVPEGSAVRRAGPGGRAMLSRLLRERLVERGRTARKPADWAARGRPLRAEEPAIVPAERHMLNARQDAALAAILALGTGDTPTVALLHGVTGSGKTEVYLRAIESALSRREGCLYLVPEIGLTPLLARALRARFGDAVEVLHSRLTPARRAAAWRRLRLGEARIALGARSAVFAPVDRLGLVIVDEEHDASYKQQESPRYHARDLAIVRAGFTGAAVVLGSATPSLESWRHAQSGRYLRLVLPERIGGRPMPEVEFVNLREEFRATGVADPLSRPLLGALGETLDRKEQAVILINRRGLARGLLCRACGEIVRCPRCSVAQVLHREGAILRCHHCGATRPQPRLCLACGSEWIQPIGEGTERIEDELRRAFPSARIARMDSDAAAAPRAQERILASFEKGETDVLVGTQMVAKGHDFPRVTLVGVLSADALLGMPDFRAAERTWQLLAQVTGRAGRGDHGGRVLIQALQPDHEVFQAVAAHDAVRFYGHEMAIRKALRHPPFTSLALVLARAAGAERARAAAEAAAGSLQRAGAGQVEVLGPAPAPIERIRGQWRFQVIARAGSRRRLGAALRAMQEETAAAGLLRLLAVDVDPVTLL